MKTSECIHSLLVAIADAGEMVDTQEILGMSMEQFIITIAAPNNIRFYYKHPNKSEQLHL